MSTKNWLCKNVEGNRSLFTFVKNTFHRMKKNTNTQSRLQTTTFHNNWIVFTSNGDFKLSAKISLLLSKGLVIYVKKLIRIIVPRIGFFYSSIASASISKTCIYYGRLFEFLNTRINLTPFFRWFLSGKKKT